MSTMISQVICPHIKFIKSIINPIPYPVCYIPVTYLFYDWRFVSLKSPSPIPHPQF